MLYWSECNLPAAAGTTSRAIAPPIPSAPSSAIHMRWVGEGMHCQEGQVKQGGRIQTPKGVVQRKGEERLKFGLVAPLCGRHHRKAEPFRLYYHLFHILYIQTVPLFTVQYCYLNTRLSQSGKPPVFPRVAQGFVCWVFMQPRCLELPVLVPLCS